MSVAMGSRGSPSDIGKRVFIMRLIILESKLAIFGVINVDDTVFGGCCDVTIVLVIFCRKNFVIDLTQCVFVIGFDLRASGVSQRLTFGNFRRFRLLLELIFSHSILY